MESFHRDVVVALHETASDVLVEHVLQNPLGRLFISGLASNKGIPAGLRVQHGHTQRAGAGKLDVEWFVPNTGYTQSVGQSTGGVDGQHQDAQWFIGRYRRSQRGGRGRLANASRTARDNDATVAERFAQRAHAISSRSESATSRAMVDPSGTIAIFGCVMIGKAPPTTSRNAAN